MNDSTDKGHMISEGRGPESNSQPRVSSLSDRVRSLRLPKRSTGGIKPLSWLPWICCLLLLCLCGFLGYQAYVAAPELEKPQAVKPTADTSSRPPSGRVALEAGGYVIPVQRVQVSPKVSGMVEELYIEEGKYFKEGETLAVLEKVDYQADHDRCQGALAAARHKVNELTRYREQEIQQLEAEWQESKVQRDQLLQDFERSRRLQFTKALADRDYEQSESAYRSMDHRVKRLGLAYELLKQGPRDEKIKSAEADVRQAQADLAKAKWRLDNCTIRAPVTGIILTKKAEKGNIVNPIAFNISASLCDMADLKRLEVDVDISERDLNRVFAGQECEIRTEAPSDTVYKGQVSRLMPEANRSKASVAARVAIQVPENDRHLRPEMRARVTFLAKEKGQTGGSRP